MDTTPDRTNPSGAVAAELPDGDPAAWEARIDELAAADPAEAPELAEQIAADLSAELDAAQAPEPEQLSMEGPDR